MTRSVRDRFLDRERFTTGTGACSGVDRRAERECQRLVDSDRPMPAINERTGDRGRPGFEPAGWNSNQMSETPLKLVPFTAVPLTVKSEWSVSSLMQPKEFMLMLKACHFH